MIVDIGDQEIELIEIIELSDHQLRLVCDDARNTYCEAVLEEDDDPDWQQSCADALLEFVEEANERGIMPGWLH